MKTNGTELVFILDRSGSMSGLEADTIGGYNAMLAKQKKEEGEASVTTVLFNHDIDLLHDRITIKGVAPITEQEYEVGGTTALLDAIGSTIHKIGNVQKRTSEEERAGKVLFVITTDGMENASREYDYAKIKAMIEHQKVTLRLGVHLPRCQYRCIVYGFEIWDSRGLCRKLSCRHSEGTQVNFQALNEAVTSFRKGEKIDRVWKESIEKDFESRK